MDSYKSQVMRGLFVFFFFISNSAAFAGTYLECTILRDRDGKTGTLLFEIDFDERTVTSESEMVYTRSGAPCYYENSGRWECKVERMDENYIEFNRKHQKIANWSFDYKLNRRTGGIDRTITLPSGKESVSSGSCSKVDGKKF